MAKKDKTPPSVDSKKAKKGKKEEPAPPASTGKKGKKDDLTQPVSAKDLSAAQRRQGRLAVAESSSWTGKLPATLLNEFAQKAKWGRVDYQVKPVKGKESKDTSYSYENHNNNNNSNGVMVWVTLSWLNPKTQENLQVLMKPDMEIIKPQESSLEARHFAATYALHRLSSHKNMSMILPPNHRKIWNDLDAKRKVLEKEDPKKAKEDYNPNPFEVLLEKRKVQEQRLKDKESKLNSESKIQKPSIIIKSVSSAAKPKEKKASIVVNKTITEPLGSDSSSIKSASTTTSTSTSTPMADPEITSFPKKIWMNAPRASIKDSSRIMIETILKKYMRLLDQLKDKDTESADDGTSRDAKQQEASNLQLLTKIGFRESHVIESFQYTTNLTESLEWLLFHVPGDDLPDAFAKNQFNSDIEIQKLASSLKKTYMINRLKEGGHSVNDIEAALELSKAHNEQGVEDEVWAGVHLSQTLISYDHNDYDSDIIDDETSQITWDEEIESLITVYSSEKIKKVNDNNNVIDVLLSPQNLKANVMALRFYKSKHYPYTFVGLHLVVLNPQYRLPQYIKVSAITQLLKQLISINVLGMSYLFNCIDWMEENLAQIIDNPGPLFDPSVLESLDTLDSGNEKQNKENNEFISRGKKNFSNSSKFTRTKDDLKRLRSKYEATQESDQLRNSLKQRKTLPAWAKSDDLIKIINSNKVSLITGETGSGKSTQIVQFILDELNKKGDFETNIMCTQPRRISAIGLAARVSEERIDDVGKETGYIIRGENKTSRDTRITFVTTGLLLRMVQGVLNNKDKQKSKESNEFFKNLGYIFIDEVHERSIDNDFLLIILKTIMNKFPKLKVVLMSATIDINVFKNYFPTEINHIHIEGRTFPIEDHYLEDILDDLQFKIKMNNRRGGGGGKNGSNYYNDYDDDYGSDDEEAAAKSMVQPKSDSKFFQDGNINYDLIAQLVDYIDQKLDKEGNTGSILIFLPGTMEINKTIQSISRLSGSEKFWCLPLHSALSSANQKKIFNNPPRGKRKIVASTNIAETSITIPDAVAVIDTGRVKNVFYDPKANSTKLVEGWSSQAEVGQRRGRAGRIRAGIAYKLYTKDTQENRMLKQPIPEIKRTRLESVYLIIKAMGISNVYEFLAKGLDPPSLENVLNAKQLLTEIGALHNDNLSGLGSYLSLLPTDYKSGKLLIFGNLFGCLESCLTLAAVSVSGNPFNVNFENRDAVKEVQIKFGNNQGDQIAILNAFNEYSSLPSNQRHKFLDTNYLSYLKMKDLISTRDQYLSILQDLGFVPLDYAPNTKSYMSLNRNSNNVTMIKSLITSASYPQIARVEFPDPEFVDTISGAIKLDPNAKNMHYWVRNETFVKDKLLKKNSGSSSSSKDTTNTDTKQIYPANRAFIHPSSTLFPVSNKPMMQRLMDSEQQKHTDSAISLPKGYIASLIKSSFVVFDSSSLTPDKLYIRDMTPTSVLSVLLFGGSIAYDLNVSSGRPSPGIVMGDWLPMVTWCKNAVLIVKLRQLLDMIITKQLEGPASDTVSFGNDVLQMVEKLLTVEFK